MINAIVLLADGFEESEAVCPIDILKRAGINVVIAGVGKSIVTSTHCLKIVADILVDEIKSYDFDLVFCPGGMPGASNLAASKSVCDILLEMNASGKLISAICASPAVVLAPLGILNGKKATCYPGCEEFFPSFSFLSDGVVVDGNLVTGKSAGFAFDLGLKFIEMLCGKEKAAEVQNSIYYK